MRCDCVRSGLASRVRMKDFSESAIAGWIIGCLFPDLAYICQSLAKLASIDYLLHHIL
jgi:hypothetical protein